MSLRNKALYNSFDSCRCVMEERSSSILATKNDEDNLEAAYCSFAVTGEHYFLQDVYVCQTCCQGTSCDDDGEVIHVDGQEEEVLGLCRSCAEICHANHNVRFLGTGVAFCDCHKIGSRSNNNTTYKKAWSLADRRSSCLLLESSRKLAQSLWPDAMEEPEVSVDAKDDKQYNFTRSNRESVDGFIRDAYRIPELQNANDESREKASLSDLLQKQAFELVQHSKETFWISSYQAKNAESLNMSALECLASQIGRNHMRNYFKPGTEWMGLEWWVQVKNISHHKKSLKEPGLESEAVDLHYDKDEVLAELFGLGIFPTLSTVTYLTGGSGTTSLVGQPPTVVFPRCYVDKDEDEDDPRPIPNLWISHPRPGNHVVFDGRMLHGAPSHLALRQRLIHTPKAASSRFPKQGLQSLRITLLVNVWKSHHPATVQCLPDSIRKTLLEMEQSRPFSVLSRNVTCVPRSYKQISIDHENDLPEDLQKRITLPFVGSYDEENENEEVEACTVVETFVPLPIVMPDGDDEDDTVLVLFGPGMEAHFAYHGGDENDGEDE